MTTSLFNTFTINNKKRSLHFNKNTLIWDCEKKHSYHILPLEDVICVSYDKPNVRVGKVKYSVDDQKELYDCFTVHYSKCNKNTWKYHSVVVHHENPAEVALWVKTLRKCLNAFKHRPKKILLFINPYGGKRRGVRIFEKHCKPLFSLAGINMTVVVSQRQNQIRDCILTLNLNVYDAIVCVGGDGTFAEAFNGLVLKECRKNGVDVDDIGADIPKPQLPVGIVPAGSTNTIAYCMHGTSDVTTSVLQVIFGGRLGLDLASVYNEQKLLKLYGSVISYGYLGDVVLESEKYRWMGPKRYEFTGFKKFLKNTGYNVELAFPSIEGRSVPMKCHADCDVCRDGDATVDGDWKMVKGKFFMVSGANISCACGRSPNGLSPYSHLGDGCVDLILVRHTNLFNNLRLLFRLSSKNKNVADLSFVEVFRTREFCFRAQSQSSSESPAPLSKVSNWNCDGEVVRDIDLRVKVRCQLLTVLSRGSRPRPVPLRPDF